ncbi:MAG: IS200/IS605 family accessory protein TnpB-related protein [bacterium]
MYHTSRYFFGSNYLHKIVKESLPWESLKLVVVENLQDLKKGKQPKRGKAFRKTLSNWNYRELLSILQMRCEENRVFFRSVNPCKTSQTWRQLFEIVRNFLERQGILPGNNQ